MLLQSRYDFVMLAFYLFVNYYDFLHTLLLRFPLTEMFYVGIVTP